MITSCESVRAQRRSEAALRESEHLFRLLTENASDVISRHTPEGVCLYASPACRTLLGYEPAEVMGRSCCDFVHPDDEAVVTGARAAIVETDEVQALTYRIRRKNGDYVWFETDARALRDAETGAVTEIHAVSRDVTARWQAEEQIKASLREKEMLLREIHHRVKNNLQIITSLLRLQAGHIHDPQTRNLFRESQHRVKAMALVHETLYQSRDLGRIAMAVYVKSLVSHLGRSYVPADNVSLKVSADNVFLGIDTAVPCALMINELVSNALKHAFPGAAGGEVRIGFRCGTNGQFVLTVSDNGLGLPGDIDLRRSNTLGLQLVTALADQLGAHMEVTRHRGTIFQISFNEHKEG